MRTRLTHKRWIQYGCIGLSSDPISRVSVQNHLEKFDPAGTDSAAFSIRVEEVRRNAPHGGEKAPPRMNLKEVQELDEHLFL